ncbi:RHS repeat domain-containing protein [Leptospira stimsonii]|uniref:RHS repeat domain-containing protein n=1 Tax=Leptospira stimsonii TaxID=2202203 RepID=UPI001FEFC706|nr:RHS repeat-associated core domain-containing protein [Leptospira stimsonii]
MLGRVSRIDYPEHPISHGRMRACYEYGTAGYITGISVQVNTNGILPGFCNKDIVENITYNEFGQTAGFELGNGIETTYTYDIKGRMVRIHSSGDVGGSAKVLQDAVYSFNNKNDIVGITNATGEFNSQYDYDYDGIGRLTNAIGSYVETADNLGKRFRQSYSYAKNGNLIAKRIHDPTNGAIQDEWTYQYTNHQVTNIDSSKTGTDTFTLQYDTNGNLTRQRDNAKDLTKRISVDSQDRIVQIQDANNAILGSYWYDEGGFRVRRSALEPKNNQFTNVEILYPSKFYGLEYIESENVVTSVNNVYLNGVRIAALNEAGALAYFLTDQVDSVSHVLDDEGNTLSRMQYLPYGDTFVHKGDTNFAPKYNSQELDRESGFYFYNARYYDPGIGRFTSADTIIDGESDTQGWNRFSYVKGNPIGAKDPTGHNVAPKNNSQKSYSSQLSTNSNAGDSCNIPAANLSKNGVNAKNYSVMTPNKIAEFQNSPKKSNNTTKNLRIASVSAELTFGPGAVMEAGVWTENTVRDDGSLKRKRGGFFYSIAPSKGVAAGVSGNAYQVNDSMENFLKGENPYRTNVTSAGPGSLITITDMKDAKNPKDNGFGLGIGLKVPLNSKHDFGTPFGLGKSFSVNNPKAMAKNGPTWPSGGDQFKTYDEWR